MARIRKWLGIFAAVNGVGIGVGLFLQCGLGSDPTGVLCDGISRALGLSFGHASLLYNLLLAVLAYFAANRSMGAGTIVYALCSGYFIEFYSRLLAGLHLSGSSLWLRLGLYAVGELVFAASLACLIHFKLGMNALDALLYKIEAKTNIRYSVQRTCCDLLYTAVGAALGGVFGIGTLVPVLLTGMLVAVFTGSGKEGGASGLRRRPATDVYRNKE